MHFGISTGIIGIVIILAFAICSLVWLSDKKSLTNRLFLLMVATSALWSVSSIESFTANSSHVIRIASNVSAALSYGLLLSCFLFTQVFNRGSLPRWVSYGLLPLSVPLLVLFGSNYTCGTITTTYNCSGGQAYGVLITAVLLLFGLILINCVSAMLSRSVPKARQSKLMFLGLGSSIGVGVLLGYILPAVHITAFNIYYSLSPIIFIGFSFYAIVRHKMFDIRFYVVRAAAYTFTLAFITLLYLVPAIYVGSHIFKVHLNTGTFLVLIPVLLLLTAGYGYLRSYLNSVTSKIFFRDEYNPEHFIAQLNSTVVRNLDFIDMLTHAAQIIETNFRAEYCLFALKETKASPQRIIGTAQNKFADADIELVRKATPKLHTKVILTERLPLKWAQLRKILTANDIAVLARLATEDDTAEEGMGYILLGAKKGGQQYNAQDIRTLTTIIDGLIVAIENATRFEEIQNFNVTLQERVEQATRELRKSNEKLRVLDTTKDEFISMASHQLRTPLTAVKGYLSMVLEGDAGKLNANQRKLLEQSYFSSQRMVYLISDLLNLSRLNTGKFVIESKPIQLADAVQSEVDQLIETAKSREISLQYDRPKQFPELLLDETKIHQVIMNFIDNAIYYTPAGGSIAVNLRETPTAVEFMVKDTGIGVPRIEQRHLFTKFFRANNAKRARPDGTGLGLFMAKKVIAAQGGAILFESVEGKGSSFGFRFSKASHAVPPVKPVLTSVT